MSLSGSMVISLYLSVYFLAKQHFSLIWRYCVLKIAIIFFLIPFGQCKYFIISKAYALFPHLIEKIHSTPMRPKGLKTRYLIVTTMEGIQFSPSLKQLSLLLLIMSILSFSMIVHQLIHYWKQVRICLNHSAQVPPSKYLDTFKELKHHLGIRRKVSLYHSQFCKSPMTTGIFSPMIFLPFEDKGTLTDSSCQYILKHELYHIKHNDFLIRFIGLIVIAVHWFNPFSYILYYELSITLEMLCDESVLKGCTENQRKEYGTLLVNLATNNNTKEKDHFFVGLSNQKNIIEIKRRILEMKSNRKQRFLLSIATLGLIVTAGGTTAFAYIPPNTITSNEGRTDTFDYTYVTDEEKIEEVSLYMPYDHFFIDADGTMTELSDDTATEKIGCSHNYIASGTIRKHTKNSDGSCTVKEYEAESCSICGDIKAGQLICTYIYPKCPH